MFEGRNILICKYCGAKIDDTFRFCCQCGRATDKSMDNKNDPEKSRTNQNRISDFGIYKNDSQVKLGDFIQVIDKKNDKVVIQGLVQFHKVNSSSFSASSSNELSNNQKLFSVDNKYFFKLDDDAYAVKILDPLFVDEHFIEENYIMADWYKYNKTDRKDFKMYKENTISELDEEVKSIVNTLNLFSPHLATSGSCSGHDKNPAWISIRIDNSRTFNDFINIFEPFKYSIDLTTSQMLNQPRNHFCGKPFFPREIALMIKTKEIGEPAYEILDEFDEYLKRIIGLRRKTDEFMDDIITDEIKRQRSR